MEDTHYDQIPSDKPSNFQNANSKNTVLRNKHLDEVKLKKGKLKRNSWPVESMQEKHHWNKQRNKNPDVEENKDYNVPNEPESVSNSENEDSTDSNDKSEKPASMAYRAIVNNDFESLKTIYKKHAGNIKSLDKHGNTGLHVASKFGRNNILRWLLKNTNLAILDKNNIGETCAHTALTKGSQENILKTLKIIIYSGKLKPVIIASEQNDNGMTVLHIAAIAGLYFVAKWLAETFGRNLSLLKNSYGQVAMHFAAARGFIKILQLLGKFGKDVANMQDKIGATPIFYAAQEGNLDCVKYMVSVMRGDHTQATEEDVTPLLVAAKAGHADVVQYLLEVTDEAQLMQQTTDGATAFHMAAANGNLEIIKILMTHKTAKEAMHIRDLHGHSAAHDAAMQENTECLKFLIDHGLNPHQPNQFGKTPYLLASQSTDPDCLAYAETLKFLEKSHGVFLVREYQTDVDEQCPLPNKRKYRRSADILSKIKSLYNARNVQATDEDQKKVSHKDVFFRDLSTTGSKKPYTDNDKQLYIQEHRLTPVSLPYVDNDSHQELQFNLQPWQSFEAGLLSGEESGYLTDDINPMKNQYLNRNTGLVNIKSCEELRSKLQEEESFTGRNMSVHDYTKNESKRKNVNFDVKNIRHVRSKSDDFSIRIKKEQHPHKIIWKQNCDIQSQDLQNKQNQFLKEGIDYSKPGAAVVLRDTITRGNKPPPQDIYSTPTKTRKTFYKPAQQITSSDTDENADIWKSRPRFREFSKKSKERRRKMEKENHYSKHIPRTEHINYTENIYSDAKNVPLLTRRVSIERSLSKDYQNILDRVAFENLQPPPLPPPRPSSQIFTVPLPLQINNYSTPDAQFSIDSLHPEEPVIDYLLDLSPPRITAPPPPAPPPLAPPPPPVPTTIAIRQKVEEQAKKNKPLGEIIQEIKSGKAAKKKPAKKVNKKNKKGKHRRNSKVTSRIEEIGKVLEESGALDPLHEQQTTRLSDYDRGLQKEKYYEMNDSWQNSRNQSPDKNRSKSPEIKKFSYLPGGILPKPKLRHIDRPSLRRARKEQLSRRDRASKGSTFESIYMGTDQWEKAYANRLKPNLLINQANKRLHSDSNTNDVYLKQSHDHGHPIHEMNYQTHNQSDGTNIVKDNYSDLMTTLKQHIDKRKPLPLPNFAAAKQFEVEERAPSELELFFKKRKEKTTQDSVTRTLASDD